MMQRSRSVFGRQSPAFPEVGEDFQGRYQLEAKLGAGGGSIVFKALDTRLNRHVALKILAPTELDTEGIARFKREALSNARLSHPHIVTVYDFDQASGLGLPYLVLELVTGGDLWSLLYEQNQSLTIEEAVQLAIDILDGLAYAHEKGVIHRDLKPENIMLADGEKLNPKITDFGLAHIRGQKRITQDGVVAGSAFYMSPEVADGKPSDHRVDLYALGVMLYELMTGQLPFYSENALAVISMHRYDAPIPPSEINPAISPTLEAIILKLMAKNPDDRFPTAEAVRDVLSNLDEDQIVISVETPQQLLDHITRIRPKAWDTEVAILRESWQHIQMGVADAKPIALISGEEGSGKTLLVQELIAKARFSGATVLQAQCTAATPLPYQPIIEMLQDYIRDHSLDIHPTLAADLAKLVPEIADSHVIEDLPSLTPEAEQIRLFSHVTQFLVEIAHEDPLILVIEDMHRTDLSSLALVRYVVRHIKGHPIFILGSYRPSELDHHHPLDNLIRDFIGQNLLERVNLPRLSREDVHMLAEAVFGTKIDTALSNAIFEQSQGNLFFVKELLKSLVLEGHVYWQDTHWRVGQLGEIVLPGSIRSIIRQELSQLSETTLDILSTAAVIGGDFHFRTLAMVTELDEELLSDAIEEAIKRRLIFEKKGIREETYLFANLALHQILLDGLNPRRQARLHLKIAKALEIQYQHRLDDHHLEKIARHYSLGARTNEDIDTAIRYLEQAADRASRIFALNNAADLYTIALDLAQDDLSPDRESRILRLREHRGMVYQQTGDFVAAAADLETVVQSPEVTQNQPRQRKVLLQLGQVYRRGEEFSQAIRTLTDAVNISRAMGDERLLADALYYLGATYWTLGKIKQGMVHHQEGYEIVQRLGLDDDVAMRVIHGLAECYMRSGDYPKLFALAEESLHLAQRLGDIEYEVENLAIIAISELWQGNAERAMALAEGMTENCQAAGFFWHQMVGKVFYGGAVAATGDYDKGLKALHEVLEVALDRYRGMLITMVLIHLGRCYLDIEALDRADHYLTLALDRAERHRLNWSDALAKAYWSMAQIRRGNLEVRTLLEDALERAHRDGDLVYLAPVYQALGELELARGNHEAALKHAEEMREMATIFQQQVQIAKADRLRARALLAVEQPETARDILTAAVQASMTIKNPRLDWELHQTLADIYDLLDDAPKTIAAQKRVRQLIRDISANLSDPSLKHSVEAYFPPLIESRTSETTLRFLVITDTFGAMVREGIKLHMDEVLRCDAILLLGDLPSKAYPALRDDLGLDLPGYCVLGNHDHTGWQAWLPRYRFNHLHTKIISLKIGNQEITIGGFSGAEAYTPGEAWHWDEDDAMREIRNLPACDILLTHTAGTPPPHYPDDPNHRGLPAIQRYIDEYQPRVALHGHFHENYRTQRGQTHIIGCFGAVLVECHITDEGWDVALQPINQHIW